VNEIKEETLPETETDRTSVREAAEIAWAAKAELEASRVKQSLEVQLFRALKIKREEYQIDPLCFSGAVDPSWQIGAEIDGLTFCLEGGQHLAVVNWRCAKGGCDSHRRARFSDLQSLGKQLALGAALAEASPRCQAHT
jgi:hypothetical protein